MKSAKQTLEENGVGLVGPLRLAVEQAMKAYAKQALEQAAYEANNSHYRFNTHVILKLIDELK